MMRISWLWGLLLVVLPGSGAAQTTAEEARALVRNYIEQHNAHDLDAVMALYAEDAVFHLNMQRPAVRGREAIAQLERFDVAARSTLYPVGLEVEFREGAWHVHMEGVIEHSEIFEAAGAVIVLAEPLQDAFVLRNGEMHVIRQPELPQACRRLILGAFTDSAAWLVDSGDTRVESLVVGGRLELTPATIPEVIEVLRAWRAQARPPEPRLVSACAGFEP